MIPPGAFQLRGAVAHAYNCTDREILVEGRAGTGKSIGILTKIYHDALKYEASRQLIVRQTRESCTQSVLVSWEEKVLGATHPLVLNGPNRANRDEYRFPNGAIVAVGGLDNPAKMFSTEWDRLYANEAHEISLEAWELFGRAMRNNRMPYQQRIADVNPREPNHWLNRRAAPCDDRLRKIETVGDYRRLQDWHVEQKPSKMRRFVSVHPDNPYYFDFDAWAWTPVGRLFLSELKSMSGHNRERMLEGRWVAAEGTVYPEFNESRHVLPPFDIPSHWPIICGWDPGYDHPTAIVWMAVAENGCYYVFDEIYEGGKSVAEHAASIHAHNAGRTVRGYYGDPQHAFSQTAQSPKTIASQAADCGIRMSPWPRSTDVQAMVERVRERLRTGMIKVFSSCTNTIAEFQSWRFKRTSKGEIPHGDDAYEDANNHAMDCIKGMVALGLGHDAGAAKVLKRQ